MDYEYTLRTSAIDLAKHLNAIGLRAEIDDDSLRDHSLKINLRLGTERLGPAIIYASKHGTKVRCHEMKDHSLAPVVVGRVLSPSDALHEWLGEGFVPATSRPEAGVDQRGGQR